MGANLFGPRSSAVLTKRKSSILYKTALRLSAAMIDSCGWNYTKYPIKMRQWKEYEFIFEYLRDDRACFPAYIYIYIFVESLYEKLKIKRTCRQASLSPPSQPARQRCEHSVNTICIISWEPEAHLCNCLVIVS